MSHPCCGGPDSREASRGGAALRPAGPSLPVAGGGVALPKPAAWLAPRAVDGLALAAAPTFALMALLTGTLGGPAEMLCIGASPLSGMTAMYLLMSVFHAGPWLRLFRSNQALA
ncbi:hypothetical protein RB623_16450 [Mesorhizobium sp. LHD-90]|uniref:hypothetical protein n=1 Tax=Mesorhizobium sp. LHD-90 TaxID=3071414 RepID=UPI0027DED481|nr:hypothetical protein [Mesorhizobium sp. LHD-90]MDQ6435650.1 hypothetical protein [Mesorhizobium sp. LHD-90]